MIKRLTSILLVMALCACFMPIVSSAQNYSDALYDYVVSEVTKGNYEINVIKYGLKEEHIAEFNQDFYDNEPQFFFFRGLSYSRSGGYVTDIYFYPTMEEDEVKEAVAFVNDSIKAIVDTLPEGLDDLEKAIYFSDYICLNFEYDTTYQIYDVYNMLKNKSGVCQAYTGVYDLLLESVGIKNRTASSDDHIWNQVLIDGKWYNIDTTWNDPVSDRRGRARRDDCMGTNASFLATHGSFNYKYECTDDSYLAYSWCDQSMNTALGFVDGDAYMLKENQILRVNLHTDESEEIYVINDKWHLASGYYIGTFSGFGSFDNELIFNDSNEIFTLDPKTGTPEVLLKPELPEYNNIYGCYISEGNTLVYYYGPQFDEYTYVEVPLVKESKPEPDPEIVAGDVNGDGFFDIFDYMLVKSICLNKTVADDALRAAADVNEDGFVDVFDYMQLKSWYMNQ